MMHIPVLFLLMVKMSSASSLLNVALGGEATQIDTYNELGAASNAIDGKRDSVYFHNSCTHTFTTTDPWWRVDLRESYIVTSITITNRGDCCAERLDGAEIRIGNSLDNNGNNNPLVATISHLSAGVLHKFTLPNPAEGQYVNVFLPGTNKYLTLCEVEVSAIKEENRNIALDGEATQIDTYNELGAASNAIDGKHDSVYFHNSCTHTFTTTDPWWRVDLKASYIVTSITITNRGDCCAERLDGAEIRVGNSLDNNGNNNPLVAKISHIQLGLSETLTVFPVEGRYVNVFLPGTDKYLSLCEVEVEGYQQEGAPKESVQEMKDPHVIVGQEHVYGGDSHSEEDVESRPL
ncbi:uncharacterized protein [Eucyclogobius newberryi]|uniref:uncharacterized protein n=1 Tax=Eucyclogobius newberryi TaxID=166745 RepID=UPI003B5C12A2